MLIACQFCGGLEPYLVAALIAAWGWLVHRCVRVR